MEKHLFRISFCVFVFITFFTIRVQTFECGTTDFAGGLITKGAIAERGEWPFLATLHLAKNNMFFCGGSLISAKHVLTGAHCIQQKNSMLQLLPIDVVVLLGAYDLTLSNETEVLKSNVSDIYVHPDWDAYEDKYDADLAILTLKETVSFTDYIRQVCIPGDNIAIDGAKGSVAGWGLTENGVGPNLAFTKHAFVRVLNDSYCYTNDSVTAARSSLRTFCGQGEDGSPNRGDSGAGFYVRFGSSWIQHGIISVLRSDATGFVYPNSIAVYTNVTSFKSWIVDIVTETGGVVSEAKMIADIEINVNCFYGYNVNESYACWLQDLNLQSDNFAVASFTGVHHYRKTDQDVKVIVFLNGTMFYLPSKIGKIFRSLTKVQINEGLRTQTIRRSHLKNLENLVEFGIAKNDIDTLNKYSLWDLPNLEKFWLEENRLKEIHVKTFEKNIKLREISLKSNAIVLGSF